MSKLLSQEEYKYLFLNGDDAIVVMNQRVLGDDIFRIPQMHYLRAFLYAKNKNIVDAMSALKQYYEEREIPQVIIEKLNQLANE